jgi:hypothetical protein
MLHATGQQPVHLLERPRMPHQIHVADDVPDACAILAKLLRRLGVIKSCRKASMPFDTVMEEVSDRRISA